MKIETYEFPEIMIPGGESRTTEFVSTKRFKPSGLALSPTRELWVIELSMNSVNQFCLDAPAVMFAGFLSAGLLTLPTVRVGDVVKLGIRNASGAPVRMNAALLETDTYERARRHEKLLIQALIKYRRLSPRALHPREWVLGGMQYRAGMVWARRLGFSELQRY